MIAKNSQVNTGNLIRDWRLLIAIVTAVAVIGMLGACSNARAGSAKQPNKSASTSAAATTLPATQSLADQAKSLVAKMSLEDKVAQMFMVTPEALSQFKGSVVASGEQTKQAFIKRPVGGVIYNSANLQSPEQVKTMLANLQKYSKERTGVPAFIAVDEEGGTVARVSGSKSMGIKPYPNMSEVGAGKDTNRALEIGTEMGKYLSNLGFNVNFAPDADVLTNPKNALLKYRAFGSDPQKVSQMTAAFTKGLQTSGVLATYKHFPGHGSTSVDSHKGITISQQDANALDSVDLLPFKDAVSQGVKLIMVSHVCFPKVVGDKTPSSLSKQIVTGIARDKMQFKGILITDAMSMGAISDNYQPAEAAVKAIQAGNDIVLDPKDFDAAYQGVLDAVKAGQISADQVNQTVTRIVTTKLEISGAK